jgi:hypothetical protein
MICGRHSSNRGAALITAILLTVLLLTLGISFLSFCQHDLYFQRQQQADRQAQVLARAALEYYQYRFYDTNTPANGAVITRDVVPGLEQFEVEREATGVGTGMGYFARGRVLDSQGRIIAEREIYCPSPNNVAQSYDSKI